MKTPNFRGVPVLAAAFVSLSLVCGANGGVLTNLVSLNISNSPSAGLVTAADGNLYGTTERGGTNNLGSVFRLSTNGTFTLLYSFTGGSDGANPYAALSLGRDGSLYGTTINGGSSHFGTVFKITTDGALTPLHSFSGGNDGGNPFGGLVQAQNGFLYGTASAGGGFGFGAVYRIGTNGAFTALYAFTGGSDGAYPYAGLVLGDDGNLYGVAAAGGASAGVSLNYGAIFQITLGGTLTPYYNFSGSDGAYPYGALTKGSDGNLYGTTSGVAPAPIGGGTVSPGTIFRITYAGVFTSLYSFTGGSDGANPYASLFQASDGNLYGTTAGTTTNGGSLFLTTTSGGLTPLGTFNGGNGSAPYGSVVQAVDGNLYGTTSAGGASNGGTIFQYSLLAPPFVIIQPESQTIINHSTATFDVLAGGTGTLAYRWLKSGTNLSDGGDIAGSTTSALTVSNVAASAAGVYAVVVSSSNGVVNSSNAFLSVVVVKPTLAILNPKPNGHVSNAVLTVTGKTKGKVPVAAVFYQLDGAGWNSAQSTNAWTNWSANVTLPPGTNLLQAYAMDESGNISMTNSVKFRYILSAPVTVLTNGFGTVSPNYNGKLLAIGQAYSMTARPKRGFGFSGWTGSATNSSAKLAFVMESNLTFMANFVDITRPVMAILTPKANAHLTNTALTATGKAGDNVAVASVFYQLNGAGWNPAQTANGWTNWTAALSLTLGTNILQAYAVDNSGNFSLTNTVKLLYVSGASRMKLTNSFGSELPNHGEVQGYARSQIIRIDSDRAGASPR